MTVLLEIFLINPNYVLIIQLRNIYVIMQELVLQRINRGDSSLYIQSHHDTHFVSMP